MVNQWNFYQKRPSEGNSEIVLYYHWKQPIENSDEVFTYKILIYSIKGHFSEEKLYIYKNKADYPTNEDKLFFAIFLSGSLAKVRSELFSIRKNRNTTRALLRYEYTKLNNSQTLHLKTRNFYPVDCEKANKDKLSIKINHGGLLQKFLYHLTPGISIFFISLMYSLPIILIVLIYLYIQNQLTILGINLISNYFILINIYLLLFSSIGLEKNRRKYIENKWIFYVNNFFKSNLYTKIY